ncbi:cytochrome P450 20A1-like [Ptychodera flava]|uniref:cytochrome P450 20A1-like n=1 Tax=Ptychodera flava TaxID=63121 RepID=UPI00396A5D45
MANVAIVIAVAVVVISLLYQCMKSTYSSRVQQVAKATTGDQKLQKSRTIPGMEKRHPEDGNLQDIADAGGLIQFLFKLHAKYGHVASFWFGKHYYVSLASPEAWKDHMKYFDRPSHLFEFIMPLVGEYSIQFANGEDAKRRRKAYDVAFQSNSIKKYLKSFQERADDLAEKISSFPSGEHIPLRESISSFGSKAFGRVLFGDYFEDEKRALKLYNVYQTTSDLLIKRMNNIEDENDKEFDVAIRAFREVIDDAVRHRHDNPPRKEEEDSDFLEVLLGFCTNEEHLFSEAISYYVGGYHTSVALLVWVFYFLSKDMDAQDKVYREIIEVLGKEQYVDAQSQTQLKYLRRFMDETLRWAVIAALAARVNYEEDTKVLEYIIPKGVGVVHALAAVLLDKDMWPDPDRFDPDRFLPENLSARHKLAFSPFGFAGKRICPGYRFAYAEATVLLTSLCRKFKFRLVEGQDIQRNFGMTTYPDKEILVLVEKRQ